MTIEFTVDGATVATDATSGVSLLEVLRDHVGATSPKAGCGIGRCGACVVLLDGRPVNACMVPSERLHGRTITTRDGLPDDLAAPVVEALRAERAVQCGACAAGLVVTLSWLRSRSPRPDPAEAATLLAGHLCRCSGYVGLRRALDRLFSP